MMSDRLPLDFDSPYTFKDYLLVINPSASVSKDVGNFKNQYGSHFGKTGKLWSQPHISLCRFIMAKYLEKSLQKELGDFLHSRQSLPAGARGFDGWANERILLRPEKERLKKLQGEMMAILRKRIRVARAFAQKLREPHLSVAMAYNEKQFQQSWAHCSNRQYQSSFLVDGVAVLSRPYSYQSPARWEWLFELPLKSEG